MQKREVVKDNQEFNNIIKTSKWVKNNYFVIYYKESNYGVPKFGIAVGTKIGKAHIRNKFKRQIRNIITNNKFLFSNKYEYIIIMKKACSELKYANMEEEIKRLIEKVSK